MISLDSPITRLADATMSGQITALSLTEQALARIERAEALNAFLHVSREAALETANRLDDRLRQGETPGKLWGIPIAVKDALCTTDAPTTCASRILVRNDKRGFTAPYDATVIARLRAAGAVIIGKTNMDEFAMGSSGENSAFGPTRHPFAADRIPGGSSSGSAVAVAAGLAPGSLGSDTGGSIRQPAALCGIVGVKPSYGRVSRYGLIAFASSLDQVGPFARDVVSAARLLEVIAGNDPHDSTSKDLAIGAYEAACRKDPKGLRIGVPEEYFGEGLDPEIERSVRQAILQLEREGCKIRPIKLPHTRYAVASYYIVANAEAASNLARFDGVRFGLRVEPHGTDLQTMYKKTRGAGFGAEVKRRILLGTYALSAGYYDAYYRKAQKVRALIRRDFEHAFTEVDAIACPTSPIPAFKVGERADNPLSMYLADIYTLPASLAGIAAISVPCAPTPAQPDRPSLPVGLQLIGPSFAEEQLFTLASTVEASSSVHN